MNAFPATAESFYALRDDRTSRCCKQPSYQTASCAVHISAATASTAVGQMMLAATANLLSRWCRRVTIVLPKTEAHPHVGMGKGDLGSLVLAQMTDADPFGDFAVREGGDSAAELTMAIGADTGVAVGPATVFITASGWLAGISPQGPIELAPVGDGNLLGAIAAACLGVAQAFKLALQLPTARLVREGIFDLFRLGWSQDVRHAPWPNGSNIGNVLMVGAGSVGSSSAYCLRASGLPGEISVVDKDEVKVENFNRSPVYGRATFGLVKATAVERFLSGSRLAAVAVPMWWNDLLTERERSSFNFDVWLPLANEFNVRSAMQENVPPLMVHASTTRNWGVNHGRHIPGRDDCLVERFPPEEVSTDELMCSTGQIQTEERAVDAALPFASLFAGLLVAADLARAQLPDYPQVPNFALLDWHGPLDQIQAFHRPRRQECPVCNGQSRSFHDRFNGKTKYRYLFQL